MLLISPVTWDHYFLLLIIPLAMLWAQLPKATWARGVFLLIIGVLSLHPVVLWDATVPGGFSSGRGSADSYTHRAGVPDYMD